MLDSLSCVVSPKALTNAFAAPVIAEERDCCRGLLGVEQKAGMLEDYPDPRGSCLSPYEPRNVAVVCQMYFYAFLSVP